MTQMLGRTFVEKQVFAQGMSLIGKVKDIEVNPDTFAITDLIVQAEKEAARKIFGEKFLFGGASIKVPVSTIDKIGDIVSLKFGIDQLKEYVVKL
jgi:sporulation protein YlmC with PRC-barrel domain